MKNILCYRSTSFSVQDPAKFKEWAEDFSCSELSFGANIHNEDSGLVYFYAQNAGLPGAMSEEGYAFYEGLQKHLHPDWCVVFKQVQFDYDNPLSVYLEAVIVTQNEVKHMDLHDLAMEDPLVRGKKTVDDWL